MRDLVVVGGGPVGLATAIYAAQAGMGVTLLERRRFPLDKPCGEGLLPEGVEELQAMGVPVDGFVPLDGIRYLDERSRVEACFARGYGLGVRRRELSSRMLDRALDLGVEVLEHTRALHVRHRRTSIAVETTEGELEARWVAAADGLQSRLRASAGLSEPVTSGPKRYGSRRHFQTPPWSRFVEVYWSPGVEAYVTPVGPKEVGVAFLWHERAPSYEAMLSRFPDLEARLRGAIALSAVKGAGPFRQSVSGLTCGRLALVGDAAGYVDAITGDGVARGFVGARLLIAHLVESGSAEGYEREIRRFDRHHRWMTELTLMLATHPPLRRRALATFERRPALFRHLLHRIA